MQGRKREPEVRSAARCLGGVGLLARRVLQAPHLQLVSGRRRGEGGLAASVGLAVPIPRVRFAALFLLRVAGCGGRGA